MPTAGTLETVRADLAVYGADTEVDFEAYAPGEEDPVTLPGQQFTLDDFSAWWANVALTVPGLWRIRTVVTGTGATGPGGREQLLAVAPALSGVGDVRHTYATTIELAEYLRAAPPLDAEDRLRRASAKVDEALLCAVYTVDDDGMPTDDKIVKGLMLATCAVVKWWESIGEDGSGASGQVQSASIAGVSLGYKRGGGNSGGKVDLFGDEARQHLVEAGLSLVGPGYE